jgi:ubiquinone/menaquinone biosynthesis C-methylase UbiE
VEPWPRRSSGKSWRSASAAALIWSGVTARSSARGAGSKRAAARARRATAGRAARNLARGGERYTETALHFDVERLPPLLIRSLPAGPLALADLGCGDGPLFAALSREGLIGATRPVYAVDLEAARLARVSARLPWIVALVASADSVPAIPDGSLDAVVSTMVMEHVPDEQVYLAEIHRVLRPGGRAYVTTVFKRTWAWYFRTRDGTSVLDTSHLREYTDLGAFRSLVTSCGLRVVPARTQAPLVPLLDPLLFRAGGRLASHRRRLRALRAAKVPIPGYYSLGVVLEH